MSHTAWRVPQRAHLFCRALAGRHEVHVVESEAGFARPRDYLSARYLRSLRSAEYQDGLITVHRVPRVSPALPVGLLRELNSMIFARVVRGIVKRHRIDRIVGTFLLPPPRSPARLIFDSFDANAEFWRYRGASAYADEIDRTEYGYLQRADAVVAASTVLAEKALALDPRGPVYYIPNGIELRRFETLDRQRARARFGFEGRIVGSLANHDSSVELDLILDAARDLAGRGIQFVIAGRGGALAEAESRARHERLDVVFPGYVPLEQAPEFISAFDVGLCVYSRTPMDDARTPMRLLMYAAAGLPTVATDLEEVRRLGLPNVVRVDDHGAAVARGILAALEMPRERPREIHAFDLPGLIARYEAVLEGAALGEEEFRAAPSLPGTSIQSVNSR